MDLKQGCRLPLAVAAARHATEDRRGRPDHRVSAFVPWDSGGAFGHEPPEHLDELRLATTNAQGESPDWLTDEWWTLVIRVWGDRGLTVCVEPTPSAILHPVVLHQIEMLRRVTPLWRLIGEAYLEDFISESDLATAALSPFHEIRVVDVSRRTPAPDRAATRWGIERLFGEMRAIQQDAGATRPVLVRLTRPSCP